MPTLLLSWLDLCPELPGGRHRRPKPLLEDRPASRRGQAWPPRKRRGEPRIRVKLWTAGQLPPQRRSGPPTRAAFLGRARGCSAFPNPRPHRQPPTPAFPRALAAQSDRGRCLLRRQKPGRTRRAPPQGQDRAAPALQAPPSPPGPEQEEPPRLLPPHPTRPHRRRRVPARCHPTGPGPPAPLYRRAGERDAPASSPGGAAPGAGGGRGRGARRVLTRCRRARPGAESSPAAAV